MNQETHKLPRWEQKADIIASMGYSWGFCRHFVPFKVVFTADALSPDGQRFVIHGMDKDKVLDELLDAVKRHEGERHGKIGQV